MLIVDKNSFSIKRVFLINHTLTPNAESQKMSLHKSNDETE